MGATQRNDSSIKGAETSTTIANDVDGARRRRERQRNARNSVVDNARHKMPCVKSSISDTVIRGHFHAVVVLLFPEIPPISEFLEKIPCTIVRQW